MDDIEIALVNGLFQNLKILKHPYRDEMDIIAYTYPALKEGFSNWPSKVREIFKVDNPNERIVKDWQAAGCPDTPSELKEWVHQDVEKLTRTDATHLVEEAAHLTGDLKNLCDVLAPLIRLFKISPGNEDTLMELLQRNGLYIWSCAEPENDFITPYRSLVETCETARQMGDEILAMNLSTMVFKGDSFPLKKTIENHFENKVEKAGEILRTLIRDGLLVVDEKNENFWETIAYVAAF